MRDKNRIPKVLSEIQQIWEQYPDLRLMQLIGNTFYGDAYYIEDEELLNLIKNYYGGQLDENE